MSKNIAVILAGCGHLDGAEIRESLLTLLELDRQDANVKVFAPTYDQFHTVNHMTGEAEETTENNKRSIIEEASRITRGPIEPLNSLDVNTFDGLIIPGGFGVAKNLSKFAFDGPQGALDPDLRKIVESFHEQKKPIGAICISPAVIAMVLGVHGVKLTIGDQKEVAEAIESTGAQHQTCSVEQICFDEQNKIVSTPAYMYDGARLKDVSAGIQKLVEKVLTL